MAGAIGWSATDLRAASLAELWACWIGHARVQGWLDAEPQAMSRDRLRELMEAYPDV